jgi:prepilin-type N-terminal cleavage/methylation domain-containing protein
VTIHHSQYKRKWNVAAPGLAYGRGFSLMELTAVVAIVGVLAMLVIPRLSQHQADAKKSSCQNIQGEIELQVRLWKRNIGSYPAANLSNIGADAAYFPVGVSACPVDSTSYTIDTTTGLVIGHTH